MNLVDTVRSVLKQKGQDIWFVSPNVWVYDAITNSAERYYRVLVNPNATLLYGP